MMHGGQMMDAGCGWMMGSLDGAWMTSDGGMMSLTSRSHGCICSAGG